MERAILHADCNGFFASVECLDHPAYWKVPMAVAGDPKARGGIILAKNELAKKYDIQTAETVYQAKRKCPQLVLVAPHFHRYQAISQQINEIYLQYTDQVEPFSIDESFLDVTGSLRYFHTTPHALADTLRERVRNEVGITISVGVSFNKVFAKIGSDMKKPDATTEITRQNFRSLVWSLPIGDMLFVGRSAAAMLQKHYIATIGDLARLPCAEVVRLFGKGGEGLWRNANGWDEEPVRTPDEREPLKSIGNGMTFRRDLLTLSEIREGVTALSDEVAARLRQGGFKCRSLQIGIRDPKMKSITRQAPLRTPTHLQCEIVAAALKIIQENWSVQPDGRCAPIRSITVTAIHLVCNEEACEQLCLWEDRLWYAKRDRLEQLETAVLALRRKHGNACVWMGAGRNDELGIRMYEQIPAEREKTTLAL